MDPDKYQKNANIRADTPLQNVISVASMLLMIAGLVGIALEFFKGDGWLSNVFSYLFSSTGTMMLIPVIAVVLWLLNRWMSAPAKSETKKSGNLPMYLMMAVGAYTIFQYAVGS
ncbi:MAG: hypothetical protein ACKE5M_01365 [Methylophilaceae bacterium]